VVPLRPGFDTIAPLCRSVEDAARIVGALSGDPVPVLAGASRAGARLLVLVDPEALPVGDAPRAAFEAAAERLVKAGARLERAASAPAAAALRLAPTLVPAEAYGVWRDAIEANPEAMYAPVRDRFRLGANIAAADCVAALRALDGERAAWRNAVAGYDAVLLPTTANLPPRLDRLLSDPQYFATENLLALRNTNLANLLGLCVLTIPTGMPSCGLMAMAAPGTDAQLLRLGAAMERAIS
jgi:aspartyl-tRNA(Asn)/glutamyl-tRNA(Gln) amidotransferase subunit A